MVFKQYIQILSKTKKSDIKNYIFIDESGVYLHMDAQKEILKLFENLSEKDNLMYIRNSDLLQEKRVIILNLNSINYYQKLYFSKISPSSS